MTSFRLKFIEIDSSMSSVVNNAELKGYMVLRAPKGTVEPVYFDAGNMAEIEAMIGVGTADWSDINEATAFNAEFGLWVSAPAGNIDEYPSYYGGMYITKTGYYPFFECADKDNVNFLTKVNFGSETSLVGEATDIPADAIVLNIGTTTPGTITVKNVTSKMISSCTSIKFDYWGDHNIAKGVLELVKQANSDSNWIIKGTDTIFATFDKAAKTLTFTSIYFDDLIDFEAFKDDTGAIPTNVENLIKAYIADGTGFVVGEDAISAGVGLESRLSWIAYIENDTYMYIVQKSPTEKETNINITSIGYDKYQYTQAFQYASDLTSANSSSVILSEGDTFVAFNDTGSTQYLSTGIYRKTDTGVELITEEFATQYIKLVGEITATGYTASTNDRSNTLYYVDSDDTIHLAEIGSDFEPKPNLLYNTLTFNVKEAVYGSALMSGGEFLGSLDEMGTDAYGTSIYWSEVLPDESMSFVEVMPVKTFDKDLDANGFFTGTRIVQDVGFGNKIAPLYVKGNRSMSYLVDKNISNGLVGNVFTLEMEPILKAGWTEAFLPKYWETTLFMDPTGHENFKATFASLRQVQKLSTIISVKKLSPSEAANPNKIVVSGRSTGTAQYVNEFLQKCPYTYKKYYFSPIGDVGLNICRIVKQKLGGWAPAGTNITGNLGGQLSRAVLAAKYDFDQKAESIFNDKGLNPICYDTKNGLCIRGQRTTLDISGGISDWAYLGHTLSFDLCRREIHDLVMMPQLFKPIDNYWCNLREKEVKNILAKRTTGSQPIWAETQQIITKAQTAETKAKRTFVIKVKVKVNTFSEFVELQFENVGQGVSLA